MKTNRLERHNTSADIVRILAVFFVMSIHFLYHTYNHNPAIGGTDGFYQLKINGYGPIDGIVKYIQEGDPTMLEGPKFFLMIMMRTVFTTCVPLFLLLTGYFMSKKTLSRSYYKGIRKTLIIFVLASIACFFFKSVHNTPAAKDAFYAMDFGKMFDALHKTQKFGLKDYVLSIFDFSGANYSWYVEMYIGLFLIAPFLNLAYNKLGSKRHKQVLVATFVLLTILPTLFNIFEFSSGSWWMNPAKDSHYQKLLPAFWMSAYPIAYYFTGAYIREYGVKLKTRSILPLFAITLVLFALFNFYRSYGDKYVSGIWTFWYGFQPYALSVMLFTMIMRIKANGWHPVVRTAFCKVADLTYGMYLLSYIFDILIYTQLTKNVISIYDKLPYYFLCVPLCFVLSMIASLIVNLIAKGIIILYEKIKAYVITHKESADKLKRQDLIFILLMLAAVFFALWKVQFGFGGNDESFHLTIPHRLTKGDALFRDEWNLSQMSSFLQLPFVWVFTLISGSTDGIVLAARIFYVFIHAGACVLIYTRLRKYGYVTLIGTVLYFLYTPYNIMTLNYDSMGMGLVVLAGVLIATADYQKKLWIILSGVCFAGAVLCCPYLASGYVLYLICMLVHLLIKKKNLNFVLNSELFSLRTFLFFTFGVGILAVLFLLFTLPRVGFGGLAENLPLMFNDPEHPSVSFGSRFTRYFEVIFKMQPLFKLAVYAYSITAIAMLIDRKRRLHRSVYLIITAGIVVFTDILLAADLTTKTYNAMMFPMLFLGITSYVLCKNKPRELFAGLFVMGILYSFCVYYGSNQGFYVISMAFAAVNVSSFVFLSQLIREMNESPDNITYAVWIKPLSFAAIALVLALQVNFQLYVKAHHCFWESDTTKLTTMIEEGPAAGLYTEQSKAKAYNDIYNDISRYWKMDDKNLLVLSERTWIYLAADKPYGTFSAWLSGEKPGSIDRLQSFYDINPDKVPQYIYVPEASKWDMNWLLGKLHSLGYTEERTAAGYALVRNQ